MTEVERAKLWNDYTKNNSIENRNRIIVEYAGLVKVVALRLVNYLGGNLELEELISFGTFGLIDAISKYNTSMDTKFETYASLRIRGAILDEVRKLDWIPRTVRKKEKLYRQTEDALQIKLGRAPTEEELIKELGITEDEYYSTRQRIAGTKLVYMDAEGSTDNHNETNNFRDSLKQSAYDTPEEHILQEELKEVLQKALGNLTLKEKRVIELYYYSDLTMIEISKVLEVTESRVSQLHSKALTKLEKHMGTYMNILYKNV